MRLVFLILPFFALSLLLSCGSGGGNAKTATPVNVGDYETTAYPGESDLSKAVKKNAQGAIEEEGDLLAGKKHGTWISYDLNRNYINEIVSYRNGVEHGVTLKMNNGRPSEKLYYANGLIHGTREQYSNTNKLTLKSNYVNGQLSGESAKYYQDGTIKEESFYKTGKLDGKAKYYDQEGKLLFEYTYKNGVKVE